MVTFYFSFLLLFVLFWVFFFYVFISLAILVKKYAYCEMCVLDVVNVPLWCYISNFVVCSFEFHCLSAKLGLCAARASVDHHLHDDFVMVFTKHGNYLRGFSSLCTFCRFISSKHDCDMCFLISLFCIYVSCDVS